MTDKAVLLALIAASSALYGFVIAYYAFARSNQSQERWQHQYSRQHWGWLKSDREIIRAIQPIRVRRIWLNRFLIIASYLFLATTLASVAFVVFAFPYAD